jgi:hypothetical protein
MSYEINCTDLLNRCLGQECELRVIVRHEHAKLVRAKRA